MRSRRVRARVRGPRLPRELEQRSGWGCVLGVRRQEKRRRRTTARRQRTRFSSRSSSILRFAAAARDERQERKKQGADQDNVEGKERRVSPARHSENKQER